MNMTRRESFLVLRVCRRLALSIGNPSRDGQPAGIEGDCDGRGTGKSVGKDG